MRGRLMSVILPQKLSAYTVEETVKNKEKTREKHLRFIRPPFLKPQ